MNRNLTLTLGLIFVFVATVVILSVVMPSPRKPTDYLVIGGAATFLCLVLLFVALITTAGRESIAPDRSPDSSSNKDPDDKDQTSRTSTDS
jgi:hypothetical protein